MKPTYGGFLLLCLFIVGSRISHHLGEISGLSKGAGENHLLLVLLVSAKIL